MKKTAGRNWTGRKPIMLAPLESEHATIRMAAAAAGKPMAVFALEVVLGAAKKILEKSSK
jgi:uncharacterized protein (DUF1778 family)